MKSISNYIDKNHYKLSIANKIDEIISENKYINQYIELFYSFDKSVFYDLPKYDNMRVLLSTQSRNEIYFLNNFKNICSNQIKVFNIDSKNHFEGLINSYNKKLSNNRVLDRFLVYLNSEENTFYDKKDKIYAQFKRLNSFPDDNILESLKDLESKKVIFVDNNYENIIKNMDFGDIVYFDVTNMKMSELKKFDRILGVVATFGVKFVIYSNYMNELDLIFKNYSYYELLDNLHKSEKHCIIVYDY